VVICLGQGTDLHMAQLMPLPLTISCSNKSRLVLSFWYQLTWIVPDKGLLTGSCCCCLWPFSRTQLSYYPSVFFFHLIQKKSFGDQWDRLFSWARMSLLSPKQQCQSTKEKRLAWLYPYFGHHWTTQIRGVDHFMPALQCQHQESKLIAHVHMLKYSVLH